MKIKIFWDVAVFYCVRMRVSQMKTLKVHKEFDPLLCAAVGIGCHQHGLEACTMDLAVC
jgi:hypothetical protein